MRDRFLASVRGNVRKGVGLMTIIKLKGRTNPRRKSFIKIRAATRGLIGKKCQLFLSVNNEAELAMRDEPDVELRCQTIRSSRSLKRCWFI